MVKACGFLLVRRWPALGGTDVWFWVLVTVGLGTFTLGAFYAIFEQDLKGLLAYSTISHLGLVTLLIGLDSALGIVAAIFHMMNHATFKASRSEERRVGKAWVSTCRSRWSPAH